jgi:hypothetical protein
MPFIFSPKSEVNIAVSGDDAEEKKDGDKKKDNPDPTGISVQNKKEELPSPQHELESLASASILDENLDMFHELITDATIKHLENNNDNSSKNEVVEKDKIEINEVVEKKEVVIGEVFYSPVFEFTCGLPIECYDDDNNFKIQKNNYFEPNKQITTDELEKYLQKNPDIESLNLSNCSKIENFDFLNRCGNLKELDLNNCENLSNLDCICNCVNLVVLNIGNTKIKDIKVIKNFKKLQIINCTSNAINNVDALLGCEYLREAILWNCTTLDNIEGLRNAGNLKLLDIDNTPVLDLLPLSNSSKLEFLFIDNCTRLSDFYTLSILKKLKFLLADGSNIIMENQLDNFANLTDLEYLSLRRRKINTVSYFSKLTKLRELVLEGCDISNLSPIENLIQIEKLDLTGNSKLRDVSPLYRMTNINTLILGGGKGDKVSKGVTAIATMNIDNIEVVRNFKKLATIDLSINPRLKSINPLEACQDLEEVELQNCVQLDDVSVLGGLKKLKKIILSSDSKIRDISFVRYLPNLEELNFNGTMVSTPGIATILRKYGKIKTLIGNDADILFQISLLSGKKKSKLQRMIMKYFGKKNQ